MHTAGSQWQLLMFPHGTELSNKHVFMFTFTVHPYIMIDNFKMFIQKFFILRQLLYSIYVCIVYIIYISIFIKKRICASSW